MQQQTRQRTTRERQSTPLPEKRRRKRQTTHRSHANTTHRHMVNHSPPFHNNRKGGEQGGERGKHNKRNTMVFGDNVRARRAARALPRTPQQKEEEKERKTRETRQATRTTHPSHHRHSITHNTMRQDKTRHALSSQQDDMRTVDSIRYLPPPHTPFNPTQTITPIPQ